MRSITIVAVALVLVACASKPAENSELNPRQVKPTDLTLEIGQTVKVAGVSVTFNRVMEDSRCPSNVTCVWAGNAAVEIRLASASAAAQTIVLNTPGPVAPNSTDWNGLRVTVVELNPAPVSPLPTQPAQYRLTLRIGGIDVS